MAAHSSASEGWEDSGGSGLPAQAAWPERHQPRRDGRI